MNENLIRGECNGMCESSNENLDWQCTVARVSEQRMEGMGSLSFAV